MAHFYNFLLDISVPFHATTSIDCLKARENMAAREKPNKKKIFVFMFLHVPNTYTVAINLI